MISCCLSAWDGEAPVVSSTRLRRARVVHKCEECGDAIAPGAVYEYYTFLDSFYRRETKTYRHKWYEHKTCATCLAVRRDHDCGEGYLIGEMWTQLGECYGYDVIDGEVDDEDPMGPPPEWARG